MPRDQHYLQIPRRALLRDLTHAQHHILNVLAYIQYRYRTKKDKSASFYITDRELAAFCACDTRTLTAAKKKLQEEGIIEYWIGEKKRTHYRLLYLPEI